MGVFISPTSSADTPVIILDATAASDAVTAAGAENGDYWRGMLASGPQRLAANLGGRVGVVVNDGKVWPLALGDGSRGQAYPVSLHTHYIAYPRDELHLVRSPLVRHAARQGFALFDGLARLAQVDRMVQWNSWLLSTNLPSEGLAAAAPEVTAALCKRFPRHAILMRGLHPYLDPHLPDRFEAAGYGLYTARQIYLFDGRKPDFLKSYNVKTDLKTLRRCDTHKLVGPDDLSEADAPRITELYRLLYLDKHSPHNPAYNETFVRQALRERWLDFRGLRHVSGRLDAICGNFQMDGVATTPFFGHDTKQPPSLGLYRLLVARLLEETAMAGRVLNYSSGAGPFKRHRGAIPVIEYNAIFTRHLTAPRRAAFAILRLLVNGPGRRFLEKEGI